MIVVFNGLQEALNTYPVLKTYHLNTDGSRFKIGINSPDVIKPKVCVLIEQDTVIGWAWATPTSYKKIIYDQNSWKAKPKVKRRKAVDAMFYVHPDYRNQGYGFQLFLETKKIARQNKAKLVCHPWDTVSIAFFKKAKVRTNNFSAQNTTQKKLDNAYYGF